MTVDEHVFYCNLLLLYIFTLPNLSCYQCFLYSLLYMYKSIIYHIHKVENIFMIRLVTPPPPLVNEFII